MRKILYVFIAALVLASCQKEESTDGVFDPVMPNKANRVYFHYMAMDNDLSIWADRNIDDMFRGATKESLRSGMILVFRDVPGDNSQIVSIFWDDRNKKMQKTIAKNYGTNLDSADPKTYETVWRDLNDMVESNSWVLGFGSHGKGWMPGSISAEYTFYNAPYTVLSKPPTRTLIKDGNKWMEMADFVAMLPDNNVEFIIMDLCYMGSVEFAYALRDKASYLILSPAEVIAQGMPYDRIIDDIFTESVRRGAKNICIEYHDYYASYSQFATISLIDCSQFKNFTDVMKWLARDRTLFDSDGLLCYDTFKKHITYDLGEFILNKLNGDPSIMNALVPVRLTTGRPLGALIIPQERYSGLSTYVPMAEYANLNEQYDLTGWAQAIYPKKSS